MLLEDLFPLLKSNNMAQYKSRGLFIHLVFNLGRKQIQVVPDCLWLVTVKVRPTSLNADGVVILLALYCTININMYNMKRVTKKLHPLLPTVTDSCAQVYLQCGQIYEDVSVQSAWSHKSTIQDIRSVGGSQDNDMICRSHSSKTRRV